MNSTLEMALFNFEYESKDFKINFDNKKREREGCLSETLKTDFANAIHELFRFELIVGCGSHSRKFIALTYIFLTREFILQKQIL